MGGDKDNQCRVVRAQGAPADEPRSVFIVLVGMRRGSASRPPHLPKGENDQAACCGDGVVV